ncbi:MAG: class A beta-lactamase-related serine hydrolase [Gammaproteobacteria bacterium]|nr:MAG: class A beta-lactamase-related serine hydrolase [Gammaproteobacteria bacterium]
MNSHAITPIATLKLSEEKVENLLARVRQEVDEGLLPSAQVAVAKDGQLALFESFGSATDESLFCIFSATKAITSSAIWILLEEEKLSLTERVADIIPAFGTNGKEVVTVEQLLTHAAGFPDAPFKTLDWLDLGRRYERFSQWRLAWEPGSRYQYHPTSTMWVLAEILEQRGGLAFQQFIRERIARPLGLTDLYVGLPADQNERVVPCSHAGSALTDADYDSMGIPKPPVTEVTEEAILSFNDPDIRAVGVPGGGGITNAAELALYYQALLSGGGNGQQIWSAQTLADARRVRTGDMTDPLFGKPVSRGLGIVIAGDETRNYRGFGHTNSPLAFGHNGAGGQLAWVDPASGISLAYLTSAHDRNEVRQGRRGVSISNRAADLAE